MKKKLTGVAIILTAVCAIVFLVSSQSVTKAQESGPGEEGTVEEVDCPPDMCYSYATSEEEKDPPEDTRGTCTCGTFYDPDCHYEYVSAFQCLPWRHVDGSSITEEWESVYNHDNQWGLRKDGYNDYQLELMCPIPTDHGLGSIKYYGNVAQIKGYFYHYNSSYASAMYVYSAKANDVESHGSKADGTIGHRTLVVTPSGSNFYPFWYTKINIADYQYSSFHGLEICYDPD